MPTSSAIGARSEGTLGPRSFADASIRESIADSAVYKSGYGVIVSIKNSGIN